MEVEEQLLEETEGMVAVVSGRGVGRDGRGGPTAAEETDQAQPMVAVRKNAVYRPLFQCNQALK